MSDGKVTLKAVLNTPPPSHNFPPNAQGTHIKRLNLDLERAKKYLEQGKSATAALRSSMGYSDETKTTFNTRWNLRTHQMARNLALHAVSSKVAYCPEKNDLIGIAAAAVISHQAVSEQAQATDFFRKENSRVDDTLKQQQLYTSDLRQANTLLGARLAEQPQKLAELRKKGEKSLVTEKLPALEDASILASSLENELWTYVERVVTSVQALMDWQDYHEADAAALDERTAIAVDCLRRLVRGESVGPDLHFEESQLVQALARNEMVESDGGVFTLQHYGKKF